jgi:hypothetical protein
VEVVEFRQIQRTFPIRAVVKPLQLHVYGFIGLHVGGANLLMLLCLRIKDLIPRCNGLVNNYRVIILMLIFLACLMIVLLGCFYSVKLEVL